MSNKQDIYTELGDEALDAPTRLAICAQCAPPTACSGPCVNACSCAGGRCISDEPLETPAQQAIACVVTTVCGVSDEALETPAPAQQALACVLQCRTQCAISDEALDPAPAHQALACACNGCRISDEALDAPEQHAAACVMPCIITAISDEPLDPAPAQEALTCGMCAVCVPCTISDEALDAPEQHAAVCVVTVTCVACGISDEEPAAH